jgi:hypothetical protein
MYVFFTQFKVMTIPNKFYSINFIIIIRLYLFGMIL